MEKCSRCGKRNKGKYIVCDCIIKYNKEIKRKVKWLIKEGK